MRLLTASAAGLMPQADIAPGTLAGRKSPSPIVQTIAACLRPPHIDVVQAMQAVGPLPPKRPSDFQSYGRH